MYISQQISTLSVRLERYEQKNTHYLFKSTSINISLLFRSFINVKSNYKQR